MTSTDNSTKNKPSDTSNENDDDERTVFVGNLADKVTDELLYELFLQGGPVEEISIPKDRETGKQKSFGFVKFKHAVSVPYACDIFKGTRLFGRDLNIKSRSNNANNKPINQEPRGLSALVQGFHNSHNNMQPNMLPHMALPQVPNPMALIDPNFLQSLAMANPYGDMKLGEYNKGPDQGRQSYKESSSRRNRDNRNDDRRHGNDRRRDDDRRHNDDRRHGGGDRRTDRWNHHNRR